MGLSRLGSALAALSLLAACSAPDNRPYDDADVLFATEMIPHHQQAVAMAKLAPAPAALVRVQVGASKIAAVLSPALGLVGGMLGEWDLSAGPTAAPMAGMPGMGGGTALGAAAPGMMTDDEMTRLESAGGPAFDHAFLQMMITHHQGALTMAKAELADGRDPEAMLMAQNISDAQQASIELMQRLLAGR